MCFGSAFIAANSSASFKVRKVFLTQHLQHSISIEISPVDSDKLAKDSSSSSSEEDENVITYGKNYTLYKKTDYLGQKKSLSLTYDTDMSIKVFAEHPSGKELLSTFVVTGIDEVAANNVSKKEGSSLPKIVLSFELTRSALVQLNKVEAKVDEVVVITTKPKASSSSNSTNATEGEEGKPKEGEGEKNETAEEPVKKTKIRTNSFPLTKISRTSHGLTQLSKQQLQAAKDRLRAYEMRDEEKVRVDKSKNDFESVIYAMRDWINEEAN